MITETKSSSLVETIDTTDATDSIDTASNGLLFEESVLNAGNDSLATNSDNKLDAKDSKDTKLSSASSVNPINLVNSVNSVNQTLSNKMISTFITGKNAEALIKFFSTTPVLIFVSYLLVRFVWSYVQKIPLLLFAIGFALGYALKIGLNSTQSNVVVTQGSYLLRDSQNLFQVAFDFNSDYDAFSSINVFTLNYKK